MASSLPRPPSLTLYSLTTSPHTHPTLPLLDPHSLYLATLLLVLCPSTTFCVRPPNLWLHKSLPRLEATGTGVVLAEGAKDVERWILNKRGGSSSGGDGEEEEGGTHSDLALSSYLDRHIEPMVYSILFPPSTAQDDSASTSSSSSTPASLERIFSRLTFPSWSAHLPFPASRTLPHSVRKSVTSTLPREWRPSTRRRHPSSNNAKAAPGMGEEVGSASSSSGRVPLGQPSRHAFWGFGREVKEDWSEEFEKKRLARQARKAMAPVVSWLEALRRSEVATSRERERESPRSPAAVEIRLFTLLAPLMVAGTDEVREVLKGHPVARLMLEEEEFGTLREWVKGEVERVWGGARVEWVGVRLGGAAAEAAQPEGLADQLGNEGAQEKEGASVPAAAGTPTSSSSSWRTYLPSFPSCPWRKPAATDAAKPSKPAEPSALRYGRYIWIGTAVLGTVGWLLASGVVSVSFEDDDEEEEGVEVREGEDEEDEEDGGEEDEEEEDGGGWRFARGDGEEEGEDDEDEEMVVDLDDDDDEYDD